MTVTQDLNHVNDNTYEDEVTITDIPKGYFPAATGNSLPEGSSTREVRVDILPLEQSPGGTMHTNPGLYVKGADETAVKVTVYEDGKVMAENTQNY